MNTIKLSEVSLTSNLIFRALLYGEAGAGKTTLLGTFPTPMLIFDFDQKLKPLIGKPGIEVIQYTVDGYQSCSKIFTQFKRDFREARKDPKWKTLGLDSLSSFDTINLRHFCLLAGKGEEDAPTLPVYQDQSNFYSFWFTELKTILDKNVIITAHEFYNIDGESGIHSIQPLITGKSILFKLPQLFEDVWYLERKGGSIEERWLHYKKMKKEVATSATLQGDGLIKNPTYEEIIKRLKQ